MEKIGINRPCPKCGKMVARIEVEYFGSRVHGAVLCDRCQKKWDRLYEEVKKYYEKKYPISKCDSCNGTGKILGETCSDCRGSGKSRSYWPSMRDIGYEIDNMW